ncbi:MAG: hypothetical protein Phog2KO_09920 [Phototrophicaceae bacterium]
MTASNFNSEEENKLPRGATSSFVHLLTLFLRYGWFINTNSQFEIAIPPSKAYQLLEIATKPSVKRLGLRKLFANSRRYFIRATRDGGFQMMTSSRVWWHPKRRTPITAILTANFEAVDENVSRLKFQNRVKARYLVGQFFYPTFFSSIVIFSEWSIWIILTCVIALYAFSWIGHRLTATIEIHEIIFFIETVLSDYTPETPQQLSSGSAEIVMEDDFVAEWDRFVEEKQS